MKRLLHVLRTAYQRSPEHLLHASWNRAFAFFSRLTDRNTRGTSPDRHYHSSRDALMRELLSRVAVGESLDSVLSGFDARRFDERVAEYSVVADWLLRMPPGHDLLDVGCVMNNPLVADLLDTRCRNVWLANVALEPLRIRNPVFYHLRELDHAFARGPQFVMVTCLSTIEHIGFDNRHYGVSAPARYRTPTSEPLRLALAKLARLLTPGGQLLASVPFGVPEVVVHPRTGRIAMQVFGSAGLAEALDFINRDGIVATAETRVATDGGWERAGPDDCAVRYGTGVPAAAAIAIIHARRT